MTPVDFFREHGLLVDAPNNDGRWHRVPTEDHPKKRNGAYRWDGELVVCQNWSTMSAAVVMPLDKRGVVRPITDGDRRIAAERRRLRDAEEQRRHSNAAQRVAELLAGATPSHHGYSLRKGFGQLEKVLVTGAEVSWANKEGERVVFAPAGAMLVPMRDFGTDQLIGGQVIHWLMDERRWEKRFLPGQRSQGAVLRLGSRSAPEIILCEGWATGRSLQLAVESVRLRMQVVVCFSAGNIVTVAPLAKARAMRAVYVYADHDASGAGAKAAEATGLPWIMPRVAGDDANDVHVDEGLGSLAGDVLRLRKKR